MKYELTHRDVPFSIAEVDHSPTKWRWSAHMKHVYGSINRVEGGQVVGTRAEVEAVARKAIDALKAA